MIPQRNLSLLSNRLAREGGRRIPEAILERDYCLAWFLVGLSRTPLRKLLVFKGGTALKRCYFGGYRFSEDLDFSLVEKVSLNYVLTELEPIYDEVQRASGIVFRFSREDRKRHQNSYTFYLNYDGPLPGATGNEVKVDITIKEQFVCPLQERYVLRGYDEYSDLPEDELVQVYSLEEIAAEKVVALTDRARNEPRDLYDLWYLTSQSHIDLAALRPEIMRKLEFRGRKFSNIIEEFSKKEPRYRKLWDIRLAAQMAELPRFDEVIRGVRRSMRAAQFVIQG
jgi:predicted nucleotidyltransferase component of viral defense system